VTELSAARSCARSANAVAVGEWLDTETDMSETLSQK
jgi:hypothetical protein